MSALRFILGALAIHVLLSVAYVRTVVWSHEVVAGDSAFLYRDEGDHLVIAGDSHAMMDIEDKRIPGAVSIASRGEDYLKNRYRLQWLFDQRAEGIDTLLLPFDAGSFSGTRVENFRPEAVWGRYMPFLTLGEQFGRRTSYAGKWGKAHLAPYAGEVETVSQWIRGRKSFRGFEQKVEQKKVAVKFEWGDDVAARHFPPGTAWPPILEQSLRAILADCRERGIRVVLVTFPVTLEYADAVEARGADEARRKLLLGELVEPGVVDHLDYEDLGFGKRKLFADADHLSPDGARLFTVKLRNDLAELGILEAP